MKIAPVRSEADYKQSLARLQNLFGAAPGTPEADELEIISLLVERYEQSRYRVPAPSALQAIRFRMQQENLTPRDLEPYIGSRSRVSEVLSGTRPLSIDMIRALHRHLGIPAESLIENAGDRQPISDAAPSRPAMVKLEASGLFKKGESFSGFLERAFGKSPALAMLRKTRTDRTNAKTDQAALQAWCAAAMLKSQTRMIDRKAAKRVITADDARSLASLSVLPNGPALVADRLAEFGIAFVALEHLPGTYLDGAAMRREDGAAVIAMTIRHDRIDNFWFTLLHEFAHVARHLVDDVTFILDDLEIRSTAHIEDEADRLAQDALIPPQLWAERSNPGLTVTDVAAIASAAGVHEAIVAGRWQREYRDYRRFAKLLGHGDVRRQLVDG